MSAIKISSKSLYARLYKFVYRRSLPKGLCLLFWANIFALAVLVPYIIWILPSLIISFIVEKDKSYIGGEEWRDNHEETGELLGTNFGLWVATYIVISFVLGTLSLFNVIEQIEGAEWAALIVWGCIVVGLTVWVANTKVHPFYRNRKYNKKLDKHKRALELNGHKLEVYTDSEISRLYRMMKDDPDFIEPTHWTLVVMEAIKGFVKRSCPTINWV